MEEKKYPIIEEENRLGSSTAAEPAIAYATDTYQDIKNQDVFDYPDDYDPGIGPYSMEELNARIDKAEADLNNPNKWIRIDDFWTAMRKEHPWL